MCVFVCCCTFPEVRFAHLQSTGRVGQHCHAPAVHNALKLCV